MTRIAFLIGATDTIVDGNYRRFANELIRRGHAVALVEMESLALTRSRVTALGKRLTSPCQQGDILGFPDRLQLDEFDVIWVMSLGMRHSFLDKVQLLFALSNRTRIYNSLDAIMHFKSKYFAATNPDVFRHPDTWASNDPAELLAIMQAEGGRWIAKPPASSFGRNVYLLTAADPNVRVILESMCGPEEDRFCLLQRYVEEIAQGEKRVLLAGGHPVGQYQRRALLDHRTNVQQGASTEPCELTPEEQVYCERIGQALKAHGAEFVGIDLVYPWVIEFNVINPGGVLTIEELTGTDLTTAIVDRIPFT